MTPAQRTIGFGGGGALIAVALVVVPPDQVLLGGAMIAAGWGLIQHYKPPSPPKPAKQGTHHERSRKHN